MINIGTIVTLKTPCLGNPTGTKGICYEKYVLGCEKIDPYTSEIICGVSIIFENGNYDGFNDKEQEELLSIVKHTDFNYTFTNVMKLSQDFDNGIFSILKEGD
jgi:hypothetical protein